MNASNYPSPVTLSANTSLVESVDVSWLVTEYSRQLNIDVSRFFGGLKEVSIRRCGDTGYLYYHPFSSAGDTGFYQGLGKHPWYYMDWKWEHETAQRYVEADMRLLEVGCGEGSFLRQLPASCVGLELNKQAAALARESGLDVRTETILEHARLHKGSYDLVCSFQVLEHIAQVHEFVIASVDSLKAGGLLIVSVPNNESFIFKEFAPILNYPPHHMGLWTVNSLLGLQRIAAIQVDAIYIEPLQTYHLGYANDLLRKHQDGRRTAALARTASRLYRNFLHRLPLWRQMASTSAATFAPYIQGHTILMAFRRRA